MSGAQAKKIDVIDVATMEVTSLVVTIGDTIRGQDWARKEYTEDYQSQAERGGLYSCFLAAKRARLPRTDGTWLDWLDGVTMPESDDEDEAVEEAPTAGESEGPSSEA